MSTTSKVLLTDPSVVWSISIPRGVKIPVTAELLGGAGGGGGSDAGSSGGAGAAGQYAKHVFTVSKGDTLTFVVGGGGGAGASSRSNATGGVAGSSMIGYSGYLFSLRKNIGNYKVYNKTDPSWGQFMNDNAVWERADSAPDFNRTYTVTVPKAGTYQWLVQATTYATVFLDGEAVTATSDFSGTPKPVDVAMSAGIHTITVVGNLNIPRYIKGGVALQIKYSPTGGIFDGSLSGGPGGNAGTSGSSGGGGGGGGASALLLNGAIIAIAGGGGGGGGAGVSSNGKTATNDYDVNSEFYNGQNGQPKRGDGGGGGGSAGGYRAGSGGPESSGDNGGNAGESADCWYIDNAFSSNQIRLGSGRIPYNTGDATLTSYGVGGSPSTAGTSGYIKLQFDTSFGSYKLGNQWKDVSDIYIKDAGVWKEAVPFIKIQGQWREFARAEIAPYKLGYGIVGADYRALAMVPEPVVYYNSGGGDSPILSGGTFTYGDTTLSWGYTDYTDYGAGLWGG